MIAKSVTLTGFTPHLLSFMFSTFAIGLSPTDIYAGNSHRIILAHPNVPHALILTEFGSEGYRPSYTDLATTDGRTTEGGIRVQGGHYPAPKEWQISCKVTRQQMQLFDWLKLVQDDTKILVTLQDWVERITIVPDLTQPFTPLETPVVNDLGLEETYGAHQVFVNIDRGYSTPINAGAWYELQFTALKNI